MSRQLVGTVHVQDEDGTDHAFGPDDTVPGWAAKKITNPLAWEGEDDEPDEPEPAKAPPGNAGEEKWRAYALDRGVPETDLAGLSRDQIKEKVAALDAPPAE